MCLLDQNHPLRLCAKRLQLKAQKLMKHITDRRERADPTIPTDLTKTHPKMNGLVNGHTHHSSPPLRNGTPTITDTSKSENGTPFEESPAIIRTVAGMSTFLQLDRGVDDMCGSTPLHGTDTRLFDQLKELGLVGYDAGEDESTTPDAAEVGEKRKLFVISYSTIKITSLIL
jgi:transcriptional activator SPT7